MSDNLPKRPFESYKFIDSKFLNSSAFPGDKKIYSNSDSYGENTYELNDTQDSSYGTEELVDSLPRTCTRSVLYLLTAFSAIVLPWGMLSKVNETGSAKGRIEPKGATQRLDSQVSGNVTTVNVKTGETVTAGQILLEIKSDILEANLQKAKRKLERQNNQLSQLEIIKKRLLLSIEITRQKNQYQEIQKNTQIYQAQQNIYTQQSQYNFQQEQKKFQIEQAKQAILSSINNYQLAKNRLKKLQEKLPIYEKAYKVGAISQQRFMKLKYSVIEAEKAVIKAEIKMAQTHYILKVVEGIYHKIINQAASEIKQAKISFEQQKSGQNIVVNSGVLALKKQEEQLKNIESKIISLTSEVSQTIKQVKFINIQIQKRIVRAPIDGIIYDFPINKAGSVVRTGQMLAQIAPKNTPFVFKAKINRQESSFLQKGMSVKMKFDDYPFQYYGVLAGKVKWISPDSNIEENQKGKIEFHDLEVTLDKPYVETANERILLTPGQTATAEIILRQRRIIDFLLDPFKKL